MLHSRPPPAVACHIRLSKQSNALLSSRPCSQQSRPLHRAVSLPDWRPGHHEPLVHSRQIVPLAATQQEAAASSGNVPLRALQTAQPVDRLRYQAKLVFEHFDADGDGRLSADELTAFFTYASRKVAWSPGLAEVLLQVQAAFSAAQQHDAPKAVAEAAKEAAAAAAARDVAAASGPSSSGTGEAGLAGSGAMPAAVAPAQGGCGVEEFIDLVRRQVSAVSCSGAYQSSALRADEAARLETQKGLSRQELFAARWVFGLLDFDADGKLQLEALERAQGIEAYIVDSKLLDADADDDGAINFEEFLVSYAKPKQVGKNVAIMLVNTLLIWAVLQLPIDAFMKTLAVAVLLMRPQLVSKPVLAIYEALQALLSGFKAQVDVVNSQQGRWRAA